MNIPSSKCRSGFQVFRLTPGSTTLLSLCVCVCGLLSVYVFDVFIFRSGSNFSKVEYQCPATECERANMTEQMLNDNYLFFFWIGGLSRFFIENESAFYSFKAKN